MERLAQEGLLPSLTVVGAGPEEGRLRALSAGLGLGARVTFVGVRTPGEVAALMRSHRILVVPSRWEEPFGIVALEGVASGCRVVGSSGGGLTEAVGPGGVTFPNGNVPALVRCLRTELGRGAAAPTEAESQHLRRHHPSVIVARYLEALGRFADLPQVEPVAETALRSRP
jgi:glycosyltransferase involved in cell wall biosynthesis